MNDKGQLLRQAQLYCVLDTQVAGYEKLFDILDASAIMGVDIFQIRDKAGSARAIMEFSSRVIRRLGGKHLFIVNDRLDIALSSNADGVHVGQDDIPLSHARRLAGKNFIIGVSCQTLSQAIEAQQQGADYIGFGSVFKTLTKPERSPLDLKLLTDVKEKLSIPVFPIGGITCDNIESLLSCGYRRAAVTRAICMAADAALAAKRLKEKINKA
ncbi:MAG: thiamine phosphate synthase [Candidatus Omnitrophota bacterium]